MLIDCPHCAAGYDLDVSELAEGGFIRCAHCRTMWAPNEADPPALGPQTPRRSSIVLEASPRTRSEPRDIIDIEVFYEEITKPAPRDPYEPPPEVFRYAPEAEPVRIVEAPARPAEAKRPVEAKVALEPKLFAAPVSEAAEPAEPSTALAIIESKTETFEDLEAFVRGVPALAADAPPEKPAAPLRLVKDEPAAKKKDRPKRARWPYAAASLAAAIVGLVVMRVDVVRLAPQTAGVYAAFKLPVNVRGLTFADVRTAQEKQDGIDVLVVTGSIANGTRKPVDLPKLRMALLDAGGAEVFTWATAAGKTSLAPGETLPFRSRVASPPANAHDIQVRFVSGRDTATP
ncbi:hypothetical protein GJW-30_1_00500 [Variibacter gotjawalensis]|uniref:Zinc finger/thioredoxin putative domain-containing protein n=1 Tax=Variibacter gotjawalensis TaxID=1333996 RepID=A0A0S3PPX3_9BRAD|nr:DUF3426 domain-containing protein [Variibacter gotjawalensis]NIK48286.1 putative Zn finger-like uncharacterized protein [Variibacter gotjawalensis]RZS50158.1 putative Zn finger-like uncharacterized protein [Variibacter gotjawalensis]BAT57988.1 hypothetical protein GJW-30_1_00500 [Variibacter gotjawalensis]